ncbi:GD12540 [Drosophila simulans]|uniref:GD12540 n=1 Tax=Drosophila simulans TaxID=7240 RepID=B4QL65_DROSI|nr:GD12540 [Drosophila simulans]
MGLGRGLGARSSQPQRLQMQMEMQTKIQIHINPDTAKYVKRTWGKHCNVLLFVSGDIDGELEPYVPVINTTDTWTLVQQGLMQAYLFYGDKIDWFLRVEPSSFVVVENLRYMIHKRKYQPSQPIYFGYELENIVTHEKTVPISSRAICFLVEYPPEMYDYYYFVYRMNIFGNPVQTP